jgi:hypothetical protein
MSWSSFNVRCRVGSLTLAHFACPNLMDLLDATNGAFQGVKPAPAEAKSPAMRHGVPRGCLLAGIAPWLIFLSTPAASGAAHSSPSDPLPGITVTAPRPPTPEELAGDAVSDFVRVHAAPSLVSGQLARWRIALCPLTQGFSPAFNYFVSARIVAVAASVGAPVQAGRCGRHNVYIVITSDPEKTIHDLAKRDSRLLGFHFNDETRNLEKITRPIQGWYVTATRGVHGDESIDEAEPLLPLEASILNQGKHPAGRAGSRLTSSISSSIVNVLIVADPSKMVGREIGAISDYLAVLTLTQALTSERCGTLPSIMDMMLPSCGGNAKSTSITAGDLAFLRALYQTDLEAVLSMETSRIGANMMRQFER